MRKRLKALTVNDWIAFAIMAAIFVAPTIYYACDSAKAVAFTLGITEEP